MESSSSSSESPSQGELSQPLGLRDLGGYLLGRRQSIERVAANPHPAIVCGLIGVVVAGFCREYDQELFTDKPLIFFVPLLASLMMGTWLYAVFCTVSPSGKRQHSWTVFMGLFWMTSPCAWLYALPVERFCPDTLTAIKANFLLLGIVATWRVVLMGRVISVLTGNPGTAILLVGSSVIVVPLILLKGMSVAVMVMGGGVHSPEQKFIKDFSGQLSFYLFFGAIVAILILGWKIHRRNPEKCACLEPSAKQVGLSWALFLPPALVAAAVASQWSRSQADLSHYQQAIALMREWEDPNQPPKRTATQRIDAVDALVKAGFPPGRNLQPPAYLARFNGESMDRCIQNFLALRPEHSPFLKAEVKLTLTRSIEFLMENSFYYFESADLESCKQLIESLPTADPLRIKLDAKFKAHLKSLEELEKAQKDAPK